MLDMQLFLLIRFNDGATAERLRFYLDPETRPDFPEEVPSNESDWVEAFEFLPVPSLMECIDESMDYVIFNDGSDIDPHEICSAIALLQPKLLLSLENVEGEESYNKWADGISTLIYAPEGLEDPEDDERYNQNLNDEDKKQLDLLDDEPEKALVYLADILVHTD